MSLIKGGFLIKSPENSRVPISSAALGYRDLLGHAVDKDGMKHLVGEITVLEMFSCMELCGIPCIFMWDLRRDSNQWITGKNIQVQIALPHCFVSVWANLQSFICLINSQHLRGNQCL